MEKREPPPPLDHDASGWAGTGKIRLRPTWFGLVIAEELHEHYGGPREWRRIIFPKEIPAR